jgi:hypothetical protein
LLALLAAAVSARAADRVGAVNPPKCAVCHKEFEAAAPQLRLVAEDVNTGQWVSLPNTRIMLCQNCGVLSLAAV